MNSKISKNQLHWTILSIFILVFLFIMVRAFSSFNKEEKVLMAGLEIRKAVASDNPIILMETNYGDIKIELFQKDAPKTVDNFINLAKTDFYDKTKFHRVIKGFMIQGGDPNSKDNDWSDDGFGGPGYYFEDEINQHKIIKGAIAMANSGLNTNGSQFFIVTAQSTPWLDGKHTVFGEVIEGMNVVEKIENLKTNNNDHPIEDAIIKDIKIIY